MFLVRLRVAVLLIPPQVPPQARLVEALQVLHRVQVLAVALEDLPLVLQAVAVHLVPVLAEAYYLALVILIVQRLVLLVLTEQLVVLACK